MKFPVARSYAGDECGHHQHAQERPGEGHMLPHMSRDGVLGLAAMVLGAAVMGLGHTPWWVGSGVSVSALLLMWLIDRVIGRSRADGRDSDKDQPGEHDLRYVRRP